VGGKLERGLVESTEWSGQGKKTVLFGFVAGPPDQSRGERGNERGSRSFSPPPTQEFEKRMRKEIGPYGKKVVRDGGFLITLSDSLNALQEATYSRMPERAHRREIDPPGSLKGPKEKPISEPSERVHVKLTSCNRKKPIGLVVPFKLRSQSECDLEKKKILRGVMRRRVRGNRSDRRGSTLILTERCGGCGGEIRKHAGRQSRGTCLSQSSARQTSRCPCSNK